MFVKSRLDHHHFRSRVCGRVSDVGVCPGSMAVQLSIGFKVESHELWLYGMCADCAKQN
jgi:Fur family ferric uptake transcriptional regulator